MLMQYCRARDAVNHLDTRFDVMLQHRHPSYWKQWFGNLKGERPEPGSCTTIQAVKSITYIPKCFCSNQKTRLCILNPAYILKENMMEK